MYQKNSGRRGRPMGYAHGNRTNRSTHAFRSGGAHTKRKQRQFKDLSKFINPASAIQSEEKYIPTHAFSDFPIEESLKKNVLTAGYTIPTPIQDQAIPPALAHKDVVGIANTGTGKTATFLIPLINKVIKDARQHVIILAPTRELAMQIDQECIKLSRGLGIRSVCTVGGMPLYKQISDLKRPHNFVIGTPGRVKDLMTRKYIDLTKFHSIVLDESDRMLDMGFVHDMKMIMSRMPENRQTLFFSATFSPEVQKIVKDFLKDPVHISVKSRDTSGSIDQNVVYLKNKQKIDVLHELLQNPELKKVLIFGATKHGVERLSLTLAHRGFKADSIHGNKNHNQRQRALRSFKDEHITILVATDVAARGLDIPDVSHVINYELPATYADYIHRIGRTGRGGKSGKALTFVE